MSLEIIGKNLNQLNNEAGGHRFQRIPPTEKNGRIHTSTVTVAILDDAYIADSKYYLREDHHYYFELFKSTGCGGQKKNKTLSAIKCIHLPTGIKQERDSRSQSKNKIEARQAVDKILDSLMFDEIQSIQNSKRAHMVGSGMRADKVRTYRFQENIIIDHASGKKYNLKQIFKGNFNKFWK